MPYKVLITDYAWLSLDNAIVTPHAAFYSEAAIEEVQQRAAEHVVQALRGERPSNLVNPAVLERLDCRLLSRD
jgi:D-3-phosphoglycerate dehydrogenase / 2-oxoglutarate reductase